MAARLAHTPGTKKTIEDKNGKNKLTDFNRECVRRGVVGGTVQEKKSKDFFFVKK
jgi:hypothetical protein